MTSSGHVDQAAVNAAFTTGIYLLITQIITTTTYLRAASLSGASRRTLALSTYVLSAVVIAIASVIWWVLALTQTHIFFLGSLEYPLGVDSWLIVVVAWIACDGAGRLIGAASRHGRGPWTVALGIIVATVLGLAGIAGPVTWLVLTLVHKSGYLPPDAPRLLAARPPHSRSCRRRMAPDPHGQDPPPQLNLSLARGT